MEAVCAYVCVCARVCILRVRSAHICFLSSSSLSASAGGRNAAAQPVCAPKDLGAGQVSHVPDTEPVPGQQKQPQQPPRQGRDPQSPGRRPGPRLVSRYGCRRSNIFFLRRAPLMRENAPDNDIFFSSGVPSAFQSMSVCVCVCRHSVQPKLDRAVRGPGHGDEGHPGGSEDERANPKGTAAASPAGDGGQAIRPHFNGPQQLQSGQG